MFLGGIMFLLWLHTFRDNAAHSMILPGFFLLWATLAVCAWDGRIATPASFRFLSLSLQALTALLISVMFFLYLLQ